MFASWPVTTFSTPGGSFSAMRCTTRAVASGADSGGFTMTVLPASSACGSEAPRIAIGQLKGTIMVTTPSGWYDTVGRAPGSRRGRPAASWTRRPRRRASRRASSGSRRRVSRPTPPCGSCRSPARGSPRRRRGRPRCPRSPGHLLGALLRRERGPGRERRLRRGHRVGDILPATLPPHARPRRPACRDRRPPAFPRSPLLAPDEQSRPHRRGRAHDVSHRDRPPFTVSPAPGSLLLHRTFTTSVTPRAPVGKIADRICVNPGDNAIRSESEPRPEEPA